MISAAFVLAKSLDYSLFRAAKEALYLPLTHRERTQGKAVIDMMIYRVAKGAASLLLITLTSGGAAMSLVSMMCIGAVAIWVILTWRVLPLYEARRAGRRYQEVDREADSSLQ